MGDAKFTPGPWAATEEAALDFYRMSSDSRDDLALVSIDDRDQDALAETVANARLIAAAPELYAVAECEEALDAFVDDEITGKQFEDILSRHGGVDMMLPDVAAWIRDKRRAALKLAREGRAE